MPSFLRFAAALYTTCCINAATFVLGLMTAPWEIHESRTRHFLYETTNTILWPVFTLRDAFGGHQVVAAAVMLGCEALVIWLAWECLVASRRPEGRIRSRVARSP